MLGPGVKVMPFDKHLHDVLQRLGESIPSTTFLVKLRYALSSWLTRLSNPR